MLLPILSQQRKFLEACDSFRFVENIGKYSREYIPDLYAAIKAKVIFNAVEYLPPNTLGTLSLIELTHW